MPFSSSIKEEALVKSRRCCCVCHEFAGVYANVHHIIQESNGGPNSLENSIVLCLRCHGEAGHYNVNHPMGNKYSPEELRSHRDWWWEWCDKNPSAPLPKTPISVSPQQITLGMKDWRTQGLFKVYNKSDEVYYQVFIKLTVDNPEIVLENLLIDIVKPKDEISAEVGPATVSGDIFRLWGIDEAGNKAIFLYLASIDPQVLCTFLLKNNTPSQSLSSNQARVSIGVCGFKQEPAAVLVRPGEMAIPFSPPENMKLQGLSILVKRTG